MDIVDGRSEETFLIKDEDRKWVEENFRWLIEVFGYPNKYYPQYNYCAEHFPITFSQRSTIVADVIDDLKAILNLDDALIDFHIVKEDSVTLFSTGVKGGLLRSVIIRKADTYQLMLAEDALQHHEMMLLNLICALVKIRLMESDLGYDRGGDDTELFIFLAGIYYGVGIMLANCLASDGHTQRVNEIVWGHEAKMPVNVILFALAMYAKLIGDGNPDWKEHLIRPLQKQFDKARHHLHEHPDDLFDESEVQCSELFAKADEYFEQRDLDAAISTLQKILFLTEDDHLKADVYNNMGYYYSRMQDWVKSIQCFRKALSYGNEFGYANDNLGYALLMMDELEEAKRYLDKAVETKNNDKAYGYRNMALYYFKCGKPDASQLFFEKAFAERQAVDLLEYHYAQFLLAHGKDTDALRYLQLAVKKDEPEAHALLNALKG